MQKAAHMTSELPLEHREHRKVTETQMQPLALWPRFLSVGMGPLPTFPSAEGCAFWPFLCTCVEGKNPLPCFLQAIHIREIQELCVSRDLPAFESIANLIYFFSQ